MQLHNSKQTLAQVAEAEDGYAALNAELSEVLKQMNPDYIMYPPLPLLPTLSHQMQLNLQFFRAPTRNFRALQRQ